MHEAMCAAMSRLALMLPRTGKAGSGADGVDWWTVLLGGGFAVSTAAAVYCFCRCGRRPDPIHGSLPAAKHLLLRQGKGREQ